MNQIVIDSIWKSFVLFCFGFSLSNLRKKLKCSIGYVRFNRDITSTIGKNIAFKLNALEAVYIFVVLLFLLAFKREIAPIYNLLDFYRASFVFVAPVSLMVILSYYILTYAEQVTGQYKAISSKEYKIRRIIFNVTAMLLVLSFFGILLER